MSWNISLVDPVTKNVLQVFGHTMIGGTYKAEYHESTGELVPAVNTDAELNVTYNYGQYYRKSGTLADGMNSLNGVSAVDSIPLLSKLIDEIEKENKDECGNWNFTKRTKHLFKNKETGETVDPYEYHTKLQSVDKLKYEPYDYEYEISEGNTEDYWEATAANAIRPLYQLLALAKLRPDGVWEVC